MKRKYQKRIKLLIKTHLNGKNLFQSLNTLSISVIRYSVRTHIALGPIPNDLEYNLEKLGISYNVETLQKSILLGTANILRKVLSIKQ